ncbi:MAG: NAD(P)H-quinone oxidoreductase subunit 4 [Pleurocapsa sp. MO_192.B19]|nr:NAD(P)H-quinone oxidoreductase subunit 4 [Pleurocapsa sp. MO_192.B19]
MTADFPWLTLLFLFPLIAAIPIPWIPDKEGKTIRWYTLGVALSEFTLITYTFWHFYNPRSPNLQLVESYSWLPQLGMHWSLAVDGLSLPLILLSALITTLAILASWRVNRKPRLYFFLLLVIYSAQVGVFLAQDLLLFFLMWELELVPAYLLLSIWGGEKCRYAATKFILYTAVGSLFILVAAFILAFAGERTSFELSQLALNNYSHSVQNLAYVAFLIGFGVKLPLFPLHTWLPDAHSEAPAPVSAILAGVLLKMGGYGLLRMNVELLPNAHENFAPILAILGVIGIIYGSLAAWAQTNLKRRIAYSSVAQMGFVLVGIASVSTLGISGALLQMISHGLIAALLFFLVGALYERTQTLQLDRMGGLGQHLPVTFTFFTTGSMAALALPGLSGFVAELMVLLGFTASDSYATAFKTIIILMAAAGIILSAIYSLTNLRQIFFGSAHGHGLTDKIGIDLRPREGFVAACLLLLILGIGLYPQLATDIFETKVTAMTSGINQTQVIASFPRASDRVNQ